MAVEGDVTIEIKASTDKFDRQIANLEKKMKKEEEKKIEKEVEIKNIQKDIADYEKAQIALKEYTEKLELAQKAKEELKETGKAVYLDPQSLITKQTDLYSDVLIEIEKAEEGLRQQNEILVSGGKTISENRAKLEQVKKEHSEINQEINQYKRQIEGIKLQKHQADVDKIKNSFKGVGNSLKESIRNVSRLVLGIFAVRSAYLALRRASSDLASYDQQYAANLEYIRYVLTQAIAPVLRWIVQMAMQLLQLINMIVNSLFGINLFANGSAESFRKMKAGAGGVSKAVKEIKKQLLGFDEINMLTDQSDTGTSGGAGGVGMPSFDLSSLEGEKPEWMGWIVDHAAEIIAAIGGIVGALALLKLGLDPLQSIGIGITISGVTYSIEKLMDYMKDPTWENFGGTLQGIGGGITGIGIATKNTSATWAGLGIIAYATVVKYWDKIKPVLHAPIDEMRKNSKEIHENAGEIAGDIYDQVTDTMDASLQTVDVGISTVRRWFDDFIDFFDGIVNEDWNKSWNAVEDIFNSHWDAIKRTAGTLVDWIYNVTLKPILGDFDEFWAKIRNGAGAAKDAIKWHFNQIKDFFRDVAGRISESFRNLGTSAGNVVAGAFKGVVNGILGAVERILNTPIRAINSLISVINKVPGVSLGTLRTFSLPRLAVGGIVNMPNKGTLVGGALAGESGRERNIAVDRPTSHE